MRNVWNSGRRGVGGGLQATHACSGCCKRWRDKTQPCSGAEPPSLRGFTWPDGGSVAVVRRQEGRGSARNLARAPLEREGLPRANAGNPWQMQSELARRVGEPSGHGKEAASQGHGGHDLLAQTDARRPAVPGCGRYLHGQPGAVGGEAARREPGSTHAEQDGVLHLGWRRWSAYQYQGFPPSVMKP